MNAPQAGPMQTQETEPAVSASRARRRPTPMYLAGWVRRAGATLIDSLIFCTPVALGASILSAAINSAPYHDPSNITAAGLIGFLIFCIGAVAIRMWNRVFLQGRTGQSIGKRAMGIRLVGARTLRPIGAGPAFGRELTHMLDVYLLVGFLLPLVDRRKQTIADKICNTLVVTTRARLLGTSRAPYRTCG